MRASILSTRKTVSNAGGTTITKLGSRWSKKDASPSGASVLERCTAEHLQYCIYSVEYEAGDEGLAKKIPFPHGIPIHPVEGWAIRPRDCIASPDPAFADRRPPQQAVR